MATLEEQLQNLIQEVNPMGSGVMSDQDVERVMSATNPPPRRLSEREIMEMRKTNPMAGMLGSASGMYQDDAMPVGTGAMSNQEQDMFMQATPSSPMQPLVDLGFGEEVNIILNNPSESEISMQAQQRIINELGTGMDIDGFLMEVIKVAPDEPELDAGADGIMGLMLAE